MTRTRISLTTFLAPIALLGLAACGDVTPPVAPTPARPQFAAQPVKGVWTVTSLDDPAEGTCTPSYCALRQAIDAAATGDRIVFKSTLTGTIALGVKKFSIDKSLTIDGGGRITIDGLGANRLFLVGSQGVSLTGLTLVRGSSDLGGAIANLGSLTLNNVIVRDNEASVWGGGIYSTGALTIIGSTITHNHAGSRGGGVSANATTEIRSSTINDNSAEDYGGGIFNTATMRVTLSTISGNEAMTTLRGGGGIYTLGNLTVRSSTITANLGFPGGSFFIGGGATSVANSIVAGNDIGLGSECSLSGGTLVSLGYNITNACPLLATQETDILVSPTQVFTEVLEQTLKDNGGPTKTHALIERGRAIDAGYCPGETTDQRGFARPYDDTRMPNALDACDIGAFEWRPPATKPGK